jgi:O-succinylbenzoic acid--CoA ligase
LAGVISIREAQQVRVVTDAFSIFAAARDAPRAIALHAEGRRYSFAELAELARARMHSFPRELAVPHALVGANTLETVLTLYALLERRVPALLLHPKLTDAERAAEIDAAARSAHALPPDAAVVMFTSGTTGRPRGAVLTRAALLASAQASAANLGWRDDDCWLLAMPLARIGGLSIVTRCLAARRAVALAPHFDAVLLPRWIEDERATLVSLVPTMLALLFDGYPDWSPPPFLRAVLVGGAAASERLLARAAARRIPIVITYGCTETCSQVVATPYEGRFDTARFGAGKPLPGAQIRIADGRIQVRGPMRMAGYLGEPPLAADAWFDTGDLGAIDAQGCLHVLGRSTELIVTGGENVHPAEVERALESCPGIEAAGVFGVADETWGQIVAAALVAPAPPTDEALGEHLASRLAAHKRPRRICFVPRLPVTPAGKPDRAALAALEPTLRPLRAR